MSLTEHDRTLLDIVASDLEFLREEWDNDVDDHSLRRSSTLLRRLLVENDLQRAWKLAGFDGQPTIKASTLADMLRTFPASKIRFASAGGATFKGVEVRAVMILDYIPEDPTIGMGEQIRPPEKESPLKEYTEEACVIVQGQFVRRRHVVKYVSNKLGGAHLDQRRGRRKDDRIYQLLDTIGSTFMLLEKPAIYFELLSIGQAIAGATDLLELTKRIRADHEIGSA